MNIIKFKDQIKPNDDLFNTFLKGKYAYWIRMRYVVPFDFISIQEYIDAESDINTLLNKPKAGLNKGYWDLHKDDLLSTFVDSNGTDEANDINQYILANSFAPDEDITLDQIKKFRTWFAKELLKFDQRADGTQKEQYYDREFTHTLQYYANGMYDETLRWISAFSSDSTSQDAKIHECGCLSNNIASYDITPHICDHINAYKKGLYENMVKHFSNIEFWTDMPQRFIYIVKKYIDNIITACLPLSESPFISTFADCNCHSVTLQMELNGIMEHMSKSLEYILEGNVMGHKNFIADSLRDWSKRLYERMEWN